MSRKSRVFIISCSSISAVFTCNNYYFLDIEEICRQTGSGLHINRSRERTQTRDPELQPEPTEKAGEGEETRADDIGQDADAV